LTKVPFQGTQTYRGESHPSRFKAKWGSEKVLTAQAGGEKKTGKEETSEKDERSLVEGIKKRSRTHSRASEKEYNGGGGGGRQKDKPNRVKKSVNFNFKGGPGL